MIKRIRGSAIRALPMLLATGAGPTLAQDFRVNPYLQNPSSDGMLFTWFTEADVPAALTISGGDLTSALTVAGALCLAAIVIWEIGLRPDAVDAVALTPDSSSI